MQKFICTANLSKDVEKRETASGKSVANFSIAINKIGAEGADFFNVVVWGNQAENCAKYLKKGSKVGIVGTLQNRSYEDRDGIKRTVTEIVASEVEFLSHSEEKNEQPQQMKLEEVEDDSDLPF
jgi:single-strand DNA-binding protein